MATRQPKTSWITGKLAMTDRQALERLADSEFEGNLSQAMRHCIRVATAGKSAGRKAPAVT